MGAAHTMKCLNNLVTALTLTATAEGLAIGTHCGLDPAVMTEVLNESTGNSWITRTHIHQRVLSRSFDDPFKLDLMLKDIGYRPRPAARGRGERERAGALGRNADGHRDPVARLTVFQLSPRRSGSYTAMQASMVPMHAAPSVLN